MDEDNSHPPLMAFTCIHFLPSVPFFIPVFVLSVNVFDGGLSPSKHHYSHFLRNVNDGDPLFISDLLITPQPNAYPPRQGSHSHSRHYFIKRVRLHRAFINNAIITQVWCTQWLSSSSAKSKMSFHCFPPVISHISHIWVGGAAE